MINWRFLSFQPRSFGELARAALKRKKKTEIFTLCSCLAVELRGRGRKRADYLSIICTPEAVSTT